MMSMKTYLLAWNPKRWQWEDLARMSQQVKNGNFMSIRWSCGRSKRIKKGDRVFLIRLGEEPRGVFASGIVLAGSYNDEHWDAARAAMGGTTMYVEVQLDALLNPETDTIIPRELLDGELFSAMHWDTQMSGISIPSKIAGELEKVWAAFSAGRGLMLAEEIEDDAIIYEGAVRRISVNAYERSPKARQKCIDYYGASCVVCGFDFRVVYGKVGDGFNVHHLKQLSKVGEQYKVDPIRDMRPVCPNCHAIIHRRNPAYSIEEVVTFLQKAWLGD